MEVDGWFLRADLSWLERVWFLALEAASCRSTSACFSFSSASSPAFNWQERKEGGGGGGGTVSLESSQVVCCMTNCGHFIIDFWAQLNLSNEAICKTATCL